MNIYLLKNLTDKPTYDVNNGFVIEAETHKQARILANYNHSNGGNIWENASKTSCKLIGYGIYGDYNNPKRRPKIILTDFHAG